MKTSITLDVPEDETIVAMIRRTARVFMECRHMAVGDVDDVESLLGELCSNAVRHARSRGGRFRVTLEHHGDHAVVVVTDWGKGMDRAGVPGVGTLRLDEDGNGRFGGFGLLLVDSLADRVEFGPSDPAGTTVRAEKRLQETAGAH